MMSTFYSDIATLLDDKFRAAKTISNAEEVDREQEELFRRAVWNYVQVDILTDGPLWEW